MTEPTDKELEAFAVEEQFLLFCDADEFTQIARAVLAKWGTPAPASQPVATPAGMEPYQRSADGTDVPPELASTARPASIAAVEVAAPSAPERVPLADEQIEKLCAEIGFTSWPEWDGGTFQEMWMQLARAIETAHGITAAQNGGKHGTD